jgi:hypothetical protein
MAEKVLNCAGIQFDGWRPARGYGFRIHPQRGAKPPSRSGLRRFGPGVAALAMAAGAVPAKADGGDAEVRARLVGTWTHLQTCSGERASFAEDGRFASYTTDSASPNGLTRVYGRYAVQGGKLLIVPLYARRPGALRLRASPTPALVLSIAQSGAGFTLQSDMKVGKAARGARSAHVRPCPTEPLGEDPGDPHGANSDGPALSPTPPPSIVR